MEQPTQELIDDLDSAVDYLPDDLWASQKKAIAILCAMDESLISDDTELEYIGP